MKNTATNLFILTVILTVSSAAVFAQRNDLPDRQWTLIEANGRRVGQTTAFIDINNTKTRFTGNTGCNQMFGTVSVRNNRIDFSGIGTTKRMCKLPAGSVPESELTRALDNVVSYQQNGNRLSLSDRRGRVVLKFRATGRPVPQPDGEPGRVDLEDRKWFLESIAGRRTFAAIEGVFINFGENRNNAGGNSGCNVFGGNYVKSGTSLSIREIIATMRACEEGDKMEVERVFLNGLRRTTRYEIRQGRLYLYRNQELLLTLRGERK